ncbi:hypothetical protein [Streptomyces ficellus]|uniref:Uncharacterized protein n=1 Tax=Streptomyces ficellus TaxID=1977088 RepID=A0A6I6FG07_9ACTN|nr:hypothetical protein [Streptomyces ficellus]QGV80057.1 hypothetical protein EIZ62_18820 [Streptomyces ficellus]
MATTATSVTSRVAGVHRWQRALAGVAALGTLPVLGWMLDSHVYPLHVGTAIAIAAHLFLVRRPVAFTRAATTVGLLLLPWGLLGMYMGMCLFWPSAALLLLSAYADPRARPAAARLMAVTGGAVTATALACAAVATWTFHLAPALAEPHTFRAVITEEAYLDSLDARYTPLQELGATGVSGTWTEELPHLEVSFPEDLPEERRAALRAEIAALPGVSGVELCPVSECG